MYRIGGGLTLSARHTPLAASPAHSGASPHHRRAHRMSRTSHGVVALTRERVNVYALATRENSCCSVLPFFNRGNDQGPLRADAPYHCTINRDVDNLSKVVLDALQRKSPLQVPFVDRSTQSSNGPSPSRQRLDGDHRDRAKHVFSMIVCRIPMMIDYH